MNTFLYKQVPLINLCPAHEDLQDKWIPNFTRYSSIKAVEYNVASGWDDAVDPSQPVAIPMLRFLRDHFSGNEDGFDGFKRVPIEIGDVREYFMMLLRI